jgi:DNA repair exonuclease SbcCD ATPase subunit
MSELAINQPIELLKGIISDLKVFSGQVGDLDDMKEELARVQAQIDSAKRQLEVMKGEVKETTYYRDKYLAEAREKLAESQRLDKEIKERSAQLTVISDDLNKIRARIGG